MDDSLKTWAMRGMLSDMCLALQTPSSFAHLKEATGIGKTELKRRLPRPLAAYKGPMDAYMRTIDNFAQAHQIETWRAWGMVTELRSADPDAGEMGVNEAAARWGVKPNALAEAFFAAMHAIQSAIRAEERPDGLYLVIQPPPPLGTLHLRFGPCPLAHLVPFFLMYFNMYSKPPPLAA